MSSSEALQILSSLRQSSLLTLFLEALTRGTSSTNPNPIELHAHDPQRYIGDMLAWIHQATAGEREFLESLFGVGGDGRMVGSTRTFKGSSTARRTRDTNDAEDMMVGGGQTLNDEEEKEDLVRGMLDRDLEGCCRPLRVSHVCRTVYALVQSFGASHKAYTTLFVFFLSDPDPRHHKVSGRRPRVVPNRQSLAILSRHYEAHYRR